MKFMFLSQTMQVTTQTATIPFEYVIDNLERASAENIIFLFKLISTVFDLPNIIYLLSYDQARMNEILSDTAQILSLIHI